MVAALICTSASARTVIDQSMKTPSSLDIRRRFGIHSFRRKTFVFTEDLYSSADFISCRFYYFIHPPRGSNREIYVTRTQGISSLLLLIIQFRQIV